MKTVFTTQEGVKMNSQLDFGSTKENENEFSLQLLHAQKENFSRQDVIIPGMKDAIEKGIFLGRAPRGYDHFGPRVKDPTKVQAHQEIKLNTDGAFIKKSI